MMASLRRFNVVVKSIDSLQNYWNKFYSFEPSKPLRRCLHQSNALQLSVDPEEKPKDDETSKKESSQVEHKDSETQVKDKSKKETWENSQSNPINTFSKVVQETSPRLQPVDLFRKFRIWMILRALRSIWGEETFTEELFLDGASSALTTVFDCLEKKDLALLEDALGEEVYNAMKEQIEQAKEQPHFTLKEIIDKQVSNAFRYIDVPKKISFVALDVEFLMKLVIRNPMTLSEEKSKPEEYYGVTEVRFESPLSQVPIDPQKKIQIIKADFVKEPDWKLTKILK
ncbi:uncharacterized protein Gasu_58650 [Galdieria sulphuraria]|uniref:Tim44-like domain-containing protein n=1 Tax=Galdieria sulphuraria TaxID=130081 RepID=M2X9L7_GALSU|nr:uncharacterized protein Gasu_58650 [Galdieria sulphuraria]EME26542.1 hypothetical protein Gasu_58650 [Galdieria sulphuraria]|eukprot:XP_005703062.1 hypothetical protein Gasu_58650 [Galdieria sulphuraria]